AFYLCHHIFFFQAEAGIRDFHVTGVQTCALPISAPPPTSDPDPTGPATVTPAAGCPTVSDPQGLTDAGTITGPTGTWRVCTLPRSEERRVGKTCRLKCYAREKQNK